MALPVFYRLTEDEYGLLASIGRRAEHDAREIVYIADELCDGAMLMSAGRVVLRPVGVKKPQEWARRGMLIHQLSLFIKKKYQHDVIAMERITAYHFSRVEFMRLMEEHPEMSVKIQNNIALRTGEMGKILAD